MKSRFRTPINARNRRVRRRTEQPSFGTAATTWRRHASSSSSSSYSFKGEKLRIAIVGSGCAGLSCALHLAPLVDQGLVAGPIDLFDNAQKQTRARTIGVGIWSTALQPFATSQRESHQLVWRGLSETHGTWLEKVGYRTPNGTWLMQSHLSPASMPSLLFVKERDLMETLQKAVHWEEHHHGTTVQVHAGKAATVGGLYEASPAPDSTNLLLPESELSMSARDYHLIIATDGIHSILRNTYGGYESPARRLTGSSAFQKGTTGADYSVAPSTGDRLEDITGVDDRGYTVFRGNAPRQLRQKDEDDISFQTWGTEKSMRFASVPLRCEQQQHREMQTWFATIADDAITAETDAERRKEQLVHAFRGWHDPVCDTIQSTPAEDILMERAVAHRHCMSPLLQLNTMTLPNLRGKRPPSSGEGPAVVFLGDAFMTVDPILAQGFTMAMEGAAGLRTSVENCCVPAGELAFDPQLLRTELRDRHDARVERLACLLRSTELVQSLSQPSTPIASFFNTRLLRPSLSLVPNTVKAPIFDAVLRYSLGMSVTGQKDA